MSALGSRSLEAHFGDEEVRFFRAGDHDALAEALLEVASDATAARACVKGALEPYEAGYAELLSRLTSQASRRGV